MKKLFSISLALLIVNSLFSQKAAKSIYVEGLGPGLLASINYDTRFAKKEDGFGARVGVGTVALGTVTGITVPIGINYLAGNKNYFEAGAGLTYTSTVSGLDNFDDDSNSSLIGNVSVGYRYQPKKNGFLFRIAFNPLFGSGVFLPWAGIVFGYKF